MVFGIDTVVNVELRRKFWCLKFAKSGGLILSVWRKCFELFTGGGIHIHGNLFRGRYLTARLIFASGAFYFSHMAAENPRR
jgi:hypothetical protein